MTLSARVRLPETSQVLVQQHAAVEGPRPAIVFPFAAGRPIRVGAISNPGSGRNLRGRQFDTIRREFTSYPLVTHHEVYSRADIIAATAELAHDEAEIIVVNGGDGTVQAVLTALLRTPSLERLPLVAVLPGGTTNMIAGDLGAGKHALRTLRRLLADAGSGRLDARVVEHPVMRVEIAADSEPIFAMFFGAGAVYHGIQFCRRRIHTLGVRGELGPGFALAIFVARLILGQRGTLLPPLRAQGKLGDEVLDEDAYFGLLVTTLSRLFLGLRPFWSRDPGSLRYAAVMDRPQHFLRALLPVMRGKPNRYVRPEFGYVSRNVDKIVLHLDSGFTLDGELFEPQPDAPVVLGGGHRAFFLLPPD